MARLIGEVPLAPLSVSSGTTYTLWSGTAPTNQRISICGYGVFQNYNTNGTPGLLTFNFATGAGSSGTSVTPVSLDQDDAETFRSTWITNPTSAPTGLTNIRNAYINPQVSVPEYFPLYNEIVLKATGILVVQYTPQVSGSVSGWLRIEE